MLILTLAPTLLIGLLLTTFFVVHRYNQLQEQLINSGKSIIQPLTSASIYALESQHIEIVKNIVAHLNQSNVKILRSITIFDAKNKPIITTTPERYKQLQLPKNIFFTQHKNIIYTRFGDSLILRSPIIWHQQNISHNAYHYLGYVAIQLDLRNVRIQQYKEVFVAILLLIICLGIATLFAYRIMCDVTGPIHNMVNTVDNIRQGQLDSRVEGYMLGELNTLKKGINSMAISLADYHQEMQKNIEQATVELRETLEQMEIQNIELNLAKKRAQEAVRIKSEFLANISHELRTPLNGVIGFTRQTLKTDLNMVQRDYLNTIEHSANNLLYIINEVLDFSKLESGKFVLEQIAFSLYEIIDNVVILLTQSAHEKGLEIILDINNNVPENVIGDPLRIQQIITNLLGNAIKFTKKGEIVIYVENRTCFYDKVELEVQIHDTGIGIPERQQSKLFQAFRQADASISRSYGGSGLGLAITQRLIKEMGGNISFYSQPNKGTIFWFQIPVNLSNVTTSNNNMMIDAVKTLEQQKVLLIEPNPNAAKATTKLLQTFLIETLSISTWSDAHNYKEDYDICLVSIPATSPPYSNYQSILDAVKNIAWRLIFLLPSSNMVDAESLKKYGVENCISKPVSKSRLLLALLNPKSANSVPVLINLTNTHKLPITVMAVDDNPANLKLIGVLLSDKVDKIILCNSAEEAIKIASKEILDLILMDIQMPKIDGVKAARLIHKIPQHIRVPIIAVTAYASAEERENLLQSGFIEYLTKPIDENSLMNTLKKYTTKKNKPNFPIQIAKIDSAAELSSSINLVPTSQLTSSVDWQLAVKQAADNESLAKELFKILIDSLPAIDDAVKRLLAGENVPDILDIIHKLHGSCSYSGVPKLKNICYQLESALKKGTHFTQLEPEWLELLDEIENLQQESSLWLDNNIIPS